MNAETIIDTTDGVDVLIIAFTRPDLLKQAVRPLNTAQVRRVFLALDGPRSDHPHDARFIDACEEVVRTSLGGRLQLEVLRRPTNLGMTRACVEAIDWFFARTDRGIIIEEDCVVDPTFFPFAAELLDRYRDEPRVMGICGSSHPTAPAVPNGASYRFVRNFGVWGWATWARAWRHNDPKLTTLPDEEIDAVLRRQGGTSAPFRYFWNGLIRACRDGRNPSWSFLWTFAVWGEGGLFIRPDRNLVSNIGFDERASQTTDSASPFNRTVTQAITFPLRHPGEIRQDVGFDRWTDRKVKGIGWALAPKQFVRKLIGGVRRQPTRA